MPRHSTGFASAACALLLLAGSPAAGAQLQDRYAFDQPAEALSQALRDVAARTGRNVIAPDELVRARQAPPLSGRFTAEEAVARLLEGTGLRYRLVDATLVIERAAEGVARPDSATDADAQAEIVVTGTHLRGGPVTSPLITIGRREIEESAPASVEELMRRLPQNVSAGVAQENFAVPGTGSDITEHGAAVNLRGLGQRATLVLVNGRRIAPSGTGSFVDISLIPITAVERVEILTDGASALYGSDAVGGVVNFILRRDLKGLETMVQAGTSTRGGGDQLLASLSGGTEWRTGRGLLTYEYRNDGQIRAGQRDFTINLPEQWSLFPRERRHSLYGTAHQELAAGVAIELSGMYATRSTDRSFFAAGPLVPIDSQATARAFGGTAALDVDLGGSWRAEAVASYHRSRNREEALQGGSLFNRFQSVNRITELSIKVDGELAQLPAGPFRAALGGGLRGERYSAVFETLVNLPAPQAGSRQVRSLYGELSLPLFGADNRRPGLEILTLTAAGRLEHYDRLGSSFDPKLGVLWSPVAGLKLRASYATSFRAPLLSETLGFYNAFLFPASLLYIDPAQAPDGVGAALVGTSPDVAPEHSRSFSAGAEFAPPRVPGLNLSATYYSIRFRDRIALPTNQIVVVGDPALEPIVTRDPALADVTRIFDGAAQVLDFSGPDFTPGNAGPEDVLVIVDARFANTAQSSTSGLDLRAGYAFELGADRFRFELNANKVFAFDDRLTSTSTVIHTLDTPYHPIDWRARAAFSWTRGPVSAVLFVNHADGYRDRRGIESRPVKSWTTLDLGLAFDGDRFASNLFKRMRLGLNVQNVLDTDPPRLVPDPGSTRGIGYDPVNATGRGRTLSVQLRRSW